MKIRFPHTVLAAVIFLIGCLPPASAEPPEKIAGLAKFEARLAAKPNDYISGGILAQLYLKAARAKADPSWAVKALELSERLSSVDPTYEPLTIEKIQALLALHEFGRAGELACARTGETGKYQNSYRAYCGDALLEQGRQAAAREIFTALAKEAPEEPGFAARVSRLLELEGRYAEAAEKMAEASKLANEISAENDELAWYALRAGNLNFQQGKFEEAERWYASAASLAPDSLALRDHLAELTAARGDIKKAAELFEQSLGEPQRPEILQALGDLAALRGDLANAAQYFTRAEKRFKEAQGDKYHFYDHHLAGLYADSMNKPDDAIKFAKADAARRATADVMDLLAWSHFRRGDYSAAKEAIEHALKQNAHSAQLLYHAGMIFTAAGEPKRGKELLGAAAKSNPKFNTFHIHR